MSISKEDLLEAMKGFRIVDHHDHMRDVLYKNRILEIDLPFFFARGYVTSDLVSSGLPDSLYKPSKAYENIPAAFSYLMEKRDKSDETWSKIAPYLGKVRNTVYYKYLLVALRNLYGYETEEIGDDWRDLSEKIRANSRRNPKWALELLGRMGVHKVTLDIAHTGPPCDKIVEDRRLAQVVRMDAFITGDFSALKAFRSEPIRSMEEHLEVMNEAFQRAGKEGAVGVKSGLAYQRIIEYREVPKHRAERAFVSGLRNVSSERRKVFEDFMMHEVCKRCAEYSFPFQIHTGIQAGNYNTITNADPTHLTNLIRRYPDVKFDIFHGGYPYCREAGILAKYFPNVYVDGCWLTHISPSAFKNALYEWLEIVPATKIFAWGGDHGIPEHTYASLEIAKQLVADVLTTKVLDGDFSKKTALWVAERIMGENAIEVYGY